MKLNYGDYLLTTGWGGQGIFDADLALGVDNDFYPQIGVKALRPIIPESAVICGTGSGYEEFLFNDDVCEHLKELFNVYNKRASKE
jgi:hypothetical protein